MSEWQKIETAPKDGRVLLSVFGGTIVFIAYVVCTRRMSVVEKGIWPFRKVIEESIDETGWRILMTSRNMFYAVHGNYGPFQPTHWQPLPEPPK
jgi:hypothetical protein